MGKGRNSKHPFRRNEINEARGWWDTKGRHLVAREFNCDDNVPKVRPPGQGAPGIRTTVLDDPKLGSNILNGRPWDELDSRERYRVVYVHKYMRVRERTPNATDEAHMRRLKLN